MKKKVLSLSLLGATLFALLACNSGNNSSSKKVAPVSSEPTAVSSSVAQVFTITFNPNYDGGASNSQSVNEGQTVSKPIDPTREGFIFGGWFIEAECENEFDFTAPVTASVTLYAKWTADNADLITVTFDLGYEGAENIVRQIEKNSKAPKPADPTREGYVFKGWYTDNTFSKKFSFALRLNENTVVYASWLREFIFEAEYTDVEDLEGTGISGDASGTNMINADTKGKYNASNGWYVSFLYIKDLTLTFEINSSEEVSNVDFFARLTAEYKNISLDPTTYKFKINGTEYSYPTIVLDNVPASASEVRPFQDFEITTKASFQKGKNTVELVTANSNLFMGTATATAPMVDCIKFYTNDTELTWAEGFPMLDNKENWVFTRN